jgi:HrpA-like RNA helicase
VKAHSKKIDDVEMEIDKLSRKAVTASQKEQLNSLRQKLQELEAQQTEFQSFCTDAFKQIARFQVSDKHVNMKDLGRRVKIEVNRLQGALPIYAKKSAIIEAVKNNLTTLIVGSTGSGKST